MKSSVIFNIIQLLNTEKNYCQTFKFVLLLEKVCNSERLK